MLRPALVLTALLIGTGCASSDDASPAPETTAPASAPVLTEAWRITDGLDRPESVVYDAQRDVLYVSNIRGGATDQDGDGFLTRVSVDGEMLDAEWVTGLDGPKGLALNGDRLYVSDIDELVEVDVETGEIVNRYPVTGAAFLNDVALDGSGSVYVTDTQTHRVHQLVNGQMELWMESERVQSPNGLTFVDGSLLLAAADSASDAARTTRYVRQVDPTTKELSMMSATVPEGSIDAIEADGRGGYFVSYWAEARVMHTSPGTEASLVAEETEGTADLDYVAEQEMLYLPVMTEGQLIAYQVAWP